MLPHKLALAIVAGTVWMGWPWLASLADDSPARPKGSRSAFDEPPPRPAGDVPEGRSPGFRGTKPPPDDDPDHRPPPPPRDRGGPREPPPEAREPRPDSREPPPEPPSDRWPYGESESMQKNDPEMYKLMKADAELDRHSLELAEQYRRASPENREKIRKQVEQVVDQHFEVRHQRRLLELKRLEEEIQRFHEAINRRLKARKELVGQRLSDLLGNEEKPKF